MHVLSADNNNGPETVQFPLLSIGVEVEHIASGLGIVVCVSNATFITQCLELHAGATAAPLSKGEVRAVAAAIKVAHDFIQMTSISERFKLTITDTWDIYINEPTSRRTPR